MSSFKVRVQDSKNRAIFYEASPTVGESRNASYTNYQLIHMPADMLAYQSTTSRTFQLAGPLVSRNADEARANLGFMNLARQWVLPNFGQGVGTPGKEGSTPPILKLWAYNNDNINGVQVVLESYSFSLPNDVDYIHEGVTVPFPTLMTLNLTLKELYSAEQLSQGAWRINLNPDNLGRANDFAGDNQEQFISENMQALGLGTRPGTAQRVGPVLGQQTLLGNIITGALRGAVSGIFQGKNVLKSIVRGGVVGLAQSPQVREVFNQVQTAGNQFIGGVSSRIADTVNSFGSGALKDPNSGQTIATQGQSATPNPDPMGRNTNPPRPRTAAEDEALRRVRIE